MNLHAGMRDIWVREVTQTRLGSNGNHFWGSQRERGLVDTGAIPVMQQELSSESQATETMLELMCGGPVFAPLL